jgi:CDP-diacylglycerol---glycerol-3-phosphate 3-phosphatidyltransferase
MNLPNKLTVSRLVLTVVFVACLSLPLKNGVSIALIIFAVASITDYLDGYLARKHNLVTNFGKLVDPLADKILIAAAFILLAVDKVMPAWIAITILAREFFVTGIRLVAANQGEVLAAEKLGKHKMLWQIITALYFMLRAASNEPLFAWAAPFFQITVFSPMWLGNFCIYFTTFLTIASGFSYFWKNRRIFADL